MDTKSQRNNRRGATTFQLMVILVPVLFAFMGFAVDLGRLYMIRAELKSAANSAALAGAARLAGFDAAIDSAGQAARDSLAEIDGFANKIDFGGRIVGESEGALTSTIEEPEYFEDVAGATGTGESTAAGTGVFRHVRVTLSAQAPTVFFRFLPLAQEGLVNIRVNAAAGVGAPLCTACGIEPIVIAAPDAAETTDFGFTAGTRYTLGYSCNGQPQPQALPGSVQRIPYLMLNRYDQDVETTEQIQGYRIGAAGLPPNVVEAKSCVNTATTETFWESAAAIPCNQNTVAPVIRAFMCGLANRFEAGVYSGCETIQDIDSFSQAVAPDTDLQDTDDFQSTYAGNGRRIITIAIAESLADPLAITLVGFRQFLLNPAANTTNVNALDASGRFLATYIGSPMPLKQGRTSGCGSAMTAGPGKVVLHQ
ncbi:MAG: hypothetical protein FJW39_05705 [Acidobacteria bacterium]|nr:hypothetical protein [Acidobacteriota bacterium]